MATHIRIVTQRGDRRIMATPGKSHNLCGSSTMTPYDVDEQEARKMTPDKLDEWVSCDQCRKIHAETAEQRRRQIIAEARSAVALNESGVLTFPGDPDY